MDWLFAPLTVTASQLAVAFAVLLAGVDEELGRDEFESHWHARTRCIGMDPETPQ